MEAAAEAAPDSLALFTDGLRLTYGELNQRAGLLAASLCSMGLGSLRETPIAVSLDRSFDYVIAALAIWKAGGVFLPLDPSWPAIRRDFVVEDAKAPVLITRSPLGGKARFVINLDAAGGAVRAPAPLPQMETRRDDLAYIVYTSGSTGQPKGVEVTHGNLLNLVFWHRRAFSVTAEDRSAHLAGLAFDAAVWELWPYLTAGAAIALAGERARTSPELLRDWIVNRQLTMAFVPTPLAEPMLAMEWPRETKLRYLLTGADTLHRYPSPRLPFRVVNNYGPTECTVVSTSGIVPPLAEGALPPLEGSPQLPSLGKPIANTRIYVLDEHLNPVQPGEIGEIYIAGAAVARGYRGRPDLTAERFLPDAFNPAPDARMYSSGDLGCLLPNGEIAFRGRKDTQEKIRGFRIEPDEIAAALARHSSIASCAVAAKTIGQEKQLVGYVVPKPGSRPNADELREFLAAALPEYMLPPAFVKLDTLPLNANGKLDRGALPLPDGSNGLASADYREPESPLEARIGAILSELLGMDRIGLDDNFFLLGGHSLLGTQLILRIRDQFGIELTLRDLFHSQTVAKLAQEVERLLIAKLESMPEDEAGRLLAQLERV